MGKGQKLYKRAKKIIPGGTMLLSKRPEMFLPEKWPAYFSKAKGVRVWDLDGKEYIDMSIMGIGTNTLGYGNKEVDSAVLKSLKKGNMSTLNCPEEVMLAERLIEINPWAEMVRYARSGGEANAIAVRIARALSGKDNIAICGYHGWHDWYLASNLKNNSNLDKHLLSGLDPIGVPKYLKNSCLPFRYGNYKEFNSAISDKAVGIVMMEVSRSVSPDLKFLKYVKKQTKKRGIVLIFDECTSGFRETLGGIYKKFKVAPDILVLGKALGNGYPITAILGIRDLMERSKKTFISSTFWTERIGFAAALSSIKHFEDTKPWKKLINNGKYLNKELSRIAKANNLEIKISGYESITSFTFLSPFARYFKTYMTQEMLKKGYLTSTLFYLTIYHDKKVVDKYIKELSNIFKFLGSVTKLSQIKYKLDTSLSHQTFERLKD